MNQLSIEFSARARSADPATSHAAAASVQSFGKQHHAVITFALLHNGPSTLYELARHTGLQHIQIGRRMSELEQLGRVRPLVMNGERVTRRGDTGRQCTVWALA